MPLVIESCRNAAVFVPPRPQKQLSPFTRQHLCLQHGFFRVILRANKFANGQAVAGHHAGPWIGPQAGVVTAYMHEGLHLHVAVATWNKSNIPGRFWVSVARAHLRFLQRVALVFAKAVPPTRDPVFQTSLYCSFFWDNPT